jgi:RHS repeat-associated protein
MSIHSTNPFFPLLVFTNFGIKRATTIRRRRLVFSPTTSTLRVFPFLNPYLSAYQQLVNVINFDAAEGIGISKIEWTVYGKIKKIVKTTLIANVPTQVTIEYEYDASGNRIYKKVDNKETIYVRDASGNVMAVYVKDPNINTGILTQNEVHLYGSSRLGVHNVNRRADNMTFVPPANQTSTAIIRGNKFFELCNHLGNVLVTVTDKKIAHYNANGVIDYYTADVVTANDYYPGGMVMPGRKHPAAGGLYRYGFNGKENDNEVKGEGNQQDYGMRIYDPRLGRFLSVDKATGTLPTFTPYGHCGNNPIANIDRDGNDYELRIFVDDNGKPQIEIISSWKIIKNASKEALDNAMNQWTALNGTKVKLNDVEFTVTIKFKTEVVDQTVSDMLSGLQDGENAYLGNYYINGDQITPKIVKDIIVVKEKDGVKEIGGSSPEFKDANTTNGNIVNSYKTSIQPDLSGLSEEDKALFSDYISKLNVENHDGTDPSTIAHEIGHTFGLSHNGSYNGGSARRDQNGNAGTSTFNASGTMAKGANLPNVGDIKNILIEAFQNGGTSSTGGLPNSRSVVSKISITPEAAKKINNSNATQVETKEIKTE